MDQFNESHPELNGFSQYYRDEVLPLLAVKEGRRKAAMDKLKVRLPIGGLIIAAISLFFFVRTGVFQVPIFGLFFGAAGMGAYASHVLKDVKAETKTHLVSAVCKYVGWSFFEEVNEPPELYFLCENGLLPKRYDRVAFEDKMTGNAHGADFEAVECHMEREDKDSDGDRKWVTVFRGSLIVIDFHREFMGRTVVLRDKGLFNSKQKSGMKRVGLVDPKFEKIFEAYGTDQVEARYLLTPDFMQRLVDLETSVDGKNIRFGFLQGLLIIAVETGNRFEAGSMLKPLTDTARTQKILDEITALYNVVDGIAKPRDFTVA